MFAKLFIKVEFIMKKFIVGLLIGTIVSSTIAFAATYVANIASFKVFVDGEEFISDPPALVIEGRTYLPLRAIGDALGISVNWNEELRQVEVGDAPVKETNNVILEDNSEISKDEISTTKNDMYYKENSNIFNLGYLLNQDAYKVKVYNDGYIAYFYNTSDYTLNPLRTYEYMLKSTDFIVTCNDYELNASLKKDILNFDYHINVLYKNDKAIVLFKQIK